MNNTTLQIELRLDRLMLRWGILVLSLGVAVPELASESVSLTSYLPAPTGSYTSLVTTQTVYFKAGITVGGTTAPAEKVDVRGYMKSSTVVDLDGAVISKSNALCTAQTTPAAGEAPVCAANWYRTFATGMLRPWVDGAVSYSAGAPGPGPSGTRYYCCPCPARVVLGDCTGTAG